MDINAVVAADCSEPMLGYDWLEKYAVTVLAHEGVVSVGGIKYQLLPRNSNPDACRVIATETRTVPARSAVIMESTFRVCRTYERQPQPVIEDWMIEPAEVSKGVYVGRALMPRQENDLPVSVINTTNADIEIEKGTLLTEAVPVNVPVEKETAVESVKKRRQKSYKHIEPLMEGVSADMTRQEKNQLWELLKTHADVFSSGKYDLGRTHLVTHRIETGDAQPVQQRLRKQAWSHQDIIQTERKDLSDAGVIREFNGPWCANVVIVTKKDGTARFCIDYRKLNEVTKKDAYPLPSIEVCLDALAGSKYFSTFDLRSGYHQIPMDADSIEKTAFITREGTFAFNVMPFGLCNAGATFQRFMDLLMAGITYKICLVYLDDIIIFSRDLKEHLARCKIVFQRLRSAGLKLKVSKCNMVRDSVQFLGHIVSGDGIATDPDKIIKVQEWPQPKNVHDVKSFYGLCSYYRKFVQNFAKIAAPLTKLMKADNKFHWDADAEESFNELKRKLTQSPILALPRQDGRFILDTDASDFAIGGVLSQVQDGFERVIAYGSRSLSKEEKNYCVTRRELLAVTEFLKKYRQYLLGRNFTIRTDHSALTWMRKTPEPIGQQARWLSLVDEFDFNIEYRAGKMHGNADAMSRMPCKDSCRQCIGKTQSSEKTRSSKINAVRARPCVQNAATVSFDDEAVAAATDGDISLKHVKTWLTADTRPEWESIRSHNVEVKSLVRMWPSLSLKNGVIYRARYCDDKNAVRYQKVLPYSHREEFIKQVHAGMNGGHVGERKTMHAVQLRAYWLGWKSTVHQVLQACEQCQKYHRGKVHKQGEMKTMNMGAPWERMGIDIVGPFPRSARGNKYMLTVIDHFTKWAEAFPIANHEATTVSRIMVEQVFARFGVPLQILSDRGSEFESNLFGELCRVMGTDKIRTTAYKPSTNGAIERLHRSLNAMIGKCVDLQQKYWCEQVPIVMAAVWASRHEATGYSPNFLMFGRELNMPIDIVSGVPKEYKDAYNSPNEYVANIQNRMREVYEKTRTTLKTAAERNKKYYDVGVKTNSYNIGDWVLYYLPKATVGRSVKFEKLFSGPFLVVKKYNEVTYGIQASKKSQVKTVHIDKLKHWFGDTPNAWIEKNADNDMDDLNLEPCENAAKVAENAATGEKRGQITTGVKTADTESHETQPAKNCSPSICRPCTVRLSPLPAQQSSETSDKEKRGQRENLSSLAYKPPAANSADSDRRMKVPTPRPAGKTQPRTLRSQFKACAVYKGRPQVEKSLQIFQTIESEIEMARTKNTPRKERESKTAGGKGEENAVTKGVE